MLTKEELRDFEQRLRKIPGGAVKAICEKAVDELTGKRIPFASIEALCDYLKEFLRQSEL